MHSLKTYSWLTVGLVALGAAAFLNSQVAEILPDGGGDGEQAIMLFGVQAMLTAVAYILAIVAIVAVAFSLFKLAGTFTADTARARPSLAKSGRWHR